MHVAIVFYNIGGYHAARLRAAQSTCEQLGWNFTAIQVTDQTKEHPWGNIEREITFPLKTLIPARTTTNATDRGPNSLVAGKLLSEFLDGLKPDVLVVPGWGFPVCHAAIRWSRRQRVPAVLMSESKWDDEKRYWWKELIKSWLYIKKFDAALVGGKLHRDYLVQLGFPSNRIFLGYDVVDNEYFAQCANVARHDPEAAQKRQSKIPLKPYFIAATRLIYRKNIARLVGAFAAYRQLVGEDKAWDLVICGSGVEESNIQRIIENYHLNDCVHLVGFITYQQIGDWYGLAHAFIHPALQEQWGLVVNEACASRLPILCSRTVGACELVHDRQNGFTFDPTSQSDITRALVDMHQLDPATRQKFGQISQEIVAHYSPSEFANGLLQAIKAALNHQ